MKWDEGYAEVVVAAVEVEVHKDQRHTINPIERGMDVIHEKNNFV